MYSYNMFARVSEYRYYRCFVEIFNEHRARLNINTEYTLIETRDLVNILGEP